MSVIFQQVHTEDMKHEGESALHRVGMFTIDHAKVEARKTQEIISIIERGKKHATST
jgi:hypothetical protein